VIDFLIVLGLLLSGVGILVVGWLGQASFVRASAPAAGDRATSEVRLRGAHWHGCEIVLCTCEGRSLLLDCIIPIGACEHHAPVDAEDVGYPVAVRARMPAIANDERLASSIAHWVDGGQPLDISIAVRHDRAVLDISDACTVVTLELDRLFGS
jgi:hypothetical protein